MDPLPLCILHLATRILPFLIVLSLIFQLHFILVLFKQQKVHWNQCWIHLWLVGDLMNFCFALIWLLWLTEVLISSKRLLLSKQFPHETVVFVTWPENVSEQKGNTEGIVKQPWQSNQAHTISYWYNLYFQPSWYTCENNIRSNVLSSSFLLYSKVCHLHPPVWL